ncbi:MAG: hypothetical protein AABX40_08710 [Candidatus Hydrothermarchaeota archaeon]
MEKGQVSIEAILVVGVAVILLISFTNLAWERFYLAREVGEAGEARMVGEFLAEAINNVYTNGEGFAIYLDPTVMNYTRLGDASRIEGTGIALPIGINTSARTIVISKNMSKTGGGVWDTTVPIIPANVAVVSPLPPYYKETTVRNNGTHVVIYADAGNIEVL